MTKEVRIDTSVSPSRGLTLTRFKEIWELATAVLRWGALIVGGLCLLVTSASIAQFPEDIALGEGIAIYILSAGFLLAYAMYWLGLTAVGLWLFRWPAELLRFFVHKIPKHAPAYMPADFSSLWSFPIWVIAVLAVFICVTLFRPQSSDLVRLGSLVVLQGFLGCALLLVRSKLKFDSTGLRISNETLDNARPIEDLRRGGYVFLAIWIAGPFFFGVNQGTFVDAAFRMAQLRKDHATVHVASPWDRRLSAAGMKKAESFLGEQYARFDDVTVRMRSIGSRVVLEVPSARKKERFISIPREAIEVE